ncbi:MAG: acylphosphatase [Bacteroidales bacterium]|jgi:acylphosphatase|nr:acylphosphatase [Bacteroidales bacterium]
MIRSVKLNIYGQVQGVGFRYSALQKANEIGVCGFVKNRTDGSVYMEIEAEPELIEEFIYWCKHDPSWSRVDEVVVVDIPFNHYTNFGVK